MQNMDLCSVAPPFLDPQFDIWLEGLRMISLYGWSLARRVKLNDDHP
jgi:hypothetical protein